MDEPAQFEDYYDLLGVEQTASRAEIMRAYRGLVKEHHPDRRSGGSSAEVATLFKHLSTAREVLSNPSRRAAYDRLGHEVYLARHRDGSALAPESDARSVAEKSTVSGPVWYDPDNESAPDETGSDSGDVDAETVIEGDADATISDLLDRDPLESAWLAFRRAWAVRAVTVGLAVVLLAGPLGSDPETATLGAAVTALAVIAVTGGHVLSTLPHEDSGSSLPASASVGLLRPEVTARIFRRGLILLAVGLALALSGPIGRPDPVGVLTATVTGGADTWLQRETLGVPALVGPANAVLAVALGVSTVAGPLWLASAGSARAWYRYHGGTGRTWPLVWDVLVALGTLALYAAVLIAAGALDIGGVSPASLAGAGLAVLLAASR